MPSDAPLDAMRNVRMFEEAPAAHGISLDEEEVNSPEHYTQGPVEAIEVIKGSMPQEAYLGYLQGNCLKYLLRRFYKGRPTTDAEKAHWYLSRLVEELRSSTLVEVSAE